MNKTYVYVGIALAVLVVLLFVFKVEFSMITGTTNPDSRILSVTTNGDLVLSDNTVQNINDYIGDKFTNVYKSLADLQTKIGDTNDSLEQETKERKSAVADVNIYANAIKGAIEDYSNTMQQDYVRYNDEMQIAGTYGCGDYQNLSTYNKSNGQKNSVANYSPLGPNDPNPRFVIRKRCGGCGAADGGSNKTLQVHRGDSQAWGPNPGCTGFIKYNSNGSVKK